MDSGDITLAIKLLTKCVQLRSSSLYKSHPDLGRSADKLAQCYAFMGNYHDCEKVLQLTLTAVGEQYGPYSIEMANELQKFTDVLFELVEEKEDLSIVQDLKTYLDKAAFIYRIHYGNWSASFKEIEDKKRRLIALERDIIKR